jgi:hypothetical protein
MYMKTNDCYVLATEQFTPDGFWSDVIGVYATQDGAEKQMLECFNEWKDYNKDFVSDYHCEECSKHCICYEHPNGDYVEWNILKKQLND